MYEIWLVGGLPTYFSDTGCYDAQFRDSDGRGAPPKAVAVPNSLGTEPPDAATRSSRERLALLGTKGIAPKKLR